MKVIIVVLREKLLVHESRIYFGMSFYLRLSATEILSTNNVIGG